MNGADAIVKCLEMEKVEYVFGYPGVAICPFYDSILNTKIKTVLVRHEQHAAHAASGYARLTGKVGVVAVTSGPGATNVITGIATAYADSIPLVVITGQVDSRLMGSDVFQEADVSGACESFVKYSYIIRNAEDVPRIVKEAFYIANSGRKGPVLIDFPIDIQNQKIGKLEYPETVSMRSYKPTVKGHTRQIDKVVRELKKAKRPLICTGGGAHLSGAADVIRSFAEKHNVPVVSTMMGLGTLPTEHPLFFGMVGNNGQAYGNRAMNQADMILLAGARVADRSIARPNEIEDNKVLVHIDVDPAEIGKNAGPSIPLVGDLKSVFEELDKEAISTSTEEWLKTLADFRREAEQDKKAKADLVTTPGTVDPTRFIRALSDAMEKDAVYVADVGQNQLWSCANCIIREGRFFTTGGMGCMGYSVPAAMGAKLAEPDRQVVAVCGDGAFQMCMMELGTMRQYNVPVKIAVIRNNVLGLVRQFQHFTYKDRFSVIDLTGSPDLESIAAAYGMKFLHLNDEAKMAETVKAFLENDESVLLQCDVDPNEVA
ncbi:MAG: biosynthetic-type acetolactate synthase large subunit [Succiniclasticum sp.]|uniref:biosynthetic-type acetolactate synthase large subunit n=1 Tax=Succiniclasticum sp. TaxID=2775030 RepID=UPI000E9DB273|nr:biosynthetic-type acetolactate synthase large subunit [Succiniclasticum sp.]MBR1495748.1 biosynthetic-type acetolactate synthase large subunit [Acidaminococcaceae bacterium]MBR1662067.1 biosynthetic-type acetolactate synthase large subunit [Acidaminococcaceae bacterium]MDY6290604.1 biosynthetic-type acetolactate synthase large subunit [Succiniclasticum sp.]HAT98569.1 biosynthetic-type acetolactate synthase large subunit [Acidaminococcaceae bacterium]